MTKWNPLKKTLFTISIILFLSSNMAFAELDITTQARNLSFSVTNARSGIRTQVDRLQGEFYEHDIAVGIAYIFVGFNDGNTTFKTSSEYFLTGWELKWSEQLDVEVREKIADFKKIQLEKPDQLVHAILGERTFEINCIEAPKPAEIKSEK